MMKETLRMLIAIASVAMASVGQGDCLEGEGEGEGAVLHARYDVYGQTQRHSVDFFRGNEQVAWRQGAVINIWSRGQRGPSLLRVFPQYQRSIRYPLAELQALNQEQPWETVSGWSHPAALGYRPQAGQAGIVQGCAVSEFVRGDRRMLWLAAADLPARIAEQGRVWQLVSLERVPQGETFGRWQQWPRTDFADVGGNEADPFLRRMIARRFVSLAYHPVRAQPVDSAFATGDDNQPGGDDHHGGGE